MVEQSPRSEFVKKLEVNWTKGNFVCVGLDTDYAQMPETAKRSKSPSDDVFHFNAEIIDATADLVCAYKPNVAFYEASGNEGMKALRESIKYIKDSYPDIPVILDAKRGDIGNTNMGYVQATFDKSELDADAITVHPYLGKEAMKPFLERADKGVIVLVRTSNPGAGEFQDLPVGQKQEPLYQAIARNVAQSWNTNGNCGVVVGATYPDELAEVRTIIGDMPILIPGIGAQGGDIEATVRAGKNSNARGIILSSSRGIIYASKNADYTQAARKATVTLHDLVNLSLTTREDLV